MLIRASGCVSISLCRHAAGRCVSANTHPTIETQPTVERLCLLLLSVYQVRHTHTTGHVFNLHSFVSKLEYKYIR